MMADKAVGLSVTISGQFLSPCGQPRGEMWANPSGGTPPYSYMWSTGETTATISNLAVGSYSVTVTDNIGTEATATAEVTYIGQYETLNPVVSLSYCDEGSPYAIFPLDDDPDPGDGILYPTQPITFPSSPVLSQTPAAIWWVLELEDFGADTYFINYLDAFGCPGSFNWVVHEPIALPPISVSGIGGSCTDASNGSATVSVPAVAGESDLFVSLKDDQGNVIDQMTCVGGNPGGWNGYTETFTGLAPGDYWVVLDVDEHCLFGALPDFLAPCADSLIFTIPDLGISCGEVIGTLYVDADGDCNLDAGENTVPQTVIAIDPGNTYTSTGSNGWFGADAPAGPTTFTEQHPILTQACPGSLNVVSGTTQTLNIGLAPDTPLDAMVTMAATPMRPGMQAHYHIQARNLTDAATGTVTLTLQLDPVLTFVGANPAPSNVAGNTLTWTDPDFTMTNVFEMDQFHVSVSLPPDPLLVGTQVNSIATVSTQNADANGTNNAATAITTVTASLDPNDKLVRTLTSQSASHFYLDQDEWIDYTIRFQNTGTDTAFNVVITDSLPPELDPTSLLVGASSHPMNWSISGPGIVRFAFPDILLPDSTTNEAESHGLVNFRIKPFLPLLAGTEIANNADIFFDFNDPVRTNDAVLVADFPEGMESRAFDVIALSPNPADDELRISLPGGVIHSVRVMAMDGRTVLTPTMKAESIAVDVSSLPEGSYVVSCTTRNGRSLHTRFIKQP